MVQHLWKWRCLLLCVPSCCLGHHTVKTHRCNSPFIVCNNSADYPSCPYFKMWLLFFLKGTYKSDSLNVSDLIKFCLPVVLPRIHLCVLYPVLLGEEHKGIHWPLAFCRCGTTGCPWGVAPVGFACRGLWGTRALKFVTVWTDGTPARQGGPALTGHAA